MRSLRSPLTSILVAGLCSGGVLMAQGTQTASISGQVVVKSGEPVAGVLVRLSSPAMQGVRTYTTDSKGRFAARLLPSGTYTITLSKEGLVTVKTEAAVGLGQSFEPHYVMAPVGAAVVEVVATASDIDKSDVKSATNFRLDNVDRLPQARNLEAVALLTPGVTTGVGGRVQIRGAMTSGNLYLMDGQNVADNVYNTRGTRMIEDAIEEVQVITGAASAEYGGMDGGVINATTRSGGNEFHGQLRWELTDADWNAVKPYYNRDNIDHRTLSTKTLSLSGYILKDKLWFSGAIYKHDLSTPQSITASIPVRTYTGTWGTYTTGNGPTGFGASYNQTESEIRRQIKLTWSLNQDHQFVGSFSNSTTNQANRNYSAGELAALVPQTNTSEFANLSWRAIWSESWTTELKVGRKKQMLSAGATNADLSPIYNYNNARFYQNGIFNSNDGGDNRNNKTLNVKASHFWDLLGSHQTDFGGEYYEGTQRARNEQTVTGYIFGVQRMNLATQQAYGLDVWTYVSAMGEAKNYTDALFVNDRWTLNPHFTFNLGLRLDHFKAENESGDSTAAARALSPRLGMKYDVKADGKYVIGASYARYNSKVLEAITNAVTSQGNPTEIDHPYIGAAGPQSFAYLTDLATLHTLYDFDEISWMSDPTVNIRLSEKLKAPTVDELQASFMYSFDNPIIGNGFLRATAVYKKWNNLLDYRAGNDGTVTTLDGSEVYIKVWGNSDKAKRNYKALELDGQVRKGKWDLQGNLTWSKLMGNYEGEGTSTPGRGEGLEYFTIQDGVRMYDSSITNPYGYLAGHVPLTARITTSYVVSSAAGDTTFGLVYRYDAGKRWSLARSIDPAALNPDLASDFGSTATQYLGERGGGGQYPGTQVYDLAITQDLPVFKVAGKPVNVFMKVRINNLFNKQQLATYSTSVPEASTLDEAWDTSSIGAVNSSSYWIDARNIAVSAAIKF